MIAKIEPEPYDAYVKRWGKWENTMKEEIDSMKKTRAWVSIDWPAHIKPNSCCWVFKGKLNTDGEIICYQVRLVARGFSQQKGRDFNNIYSPIVKLDSIRIVVLAFACLFDFEILYTDVKITFFLYGQLDETIYIDQSTGFSDDTKKVYVLKKSIYGLRQSSRMWK